ncbi:Uncharacterised protein [Klebsiella pneumoniae]|nr:Uncharacterised protein [Klebsiella pneumoniae]SLV66697.1 Uncharacterised protein [Klebsiella pneumoniae]
MAKFSEAISTPVSTPNARLSVATTTTTVASITTLVDSGWLRRLLMERQEKVPMETMIITATRAAMGIRDTQSRRNTTISSSTTPAVSVESRPRPPDLTLITDWPIIAQPAMPPIKEVQMLATPCALHSRFLSLGVSVMSSTMVAVIIDSSSPTTASPAEYGRIIISVSRLSGISGIRNTGRLSGSLPMSPTVRTSRCSHMEMAVSTMMQTSGEGMVLFRYGKR